MDVDEPVGAQDLAVLDGTRPFKLLCTRLGRKGLFFPKSGPFFDNTNLE